MRLSRRLDRIEKVMADKPCPECGDRGPLRWHFTSDSDDEPEPEPCRMCGAAPALVIEFCEVVSSTTGE